MLDHSELANLYRQARGEKLSGKELKTAMAAMDADGSGKIEFFEFEAWSVSRPHLRAFHSSRFAVNRVGGEAVTCNVKFDAAAIYRWRSNGGDLEARRELALTIFTDEVPLLLVAPSNATKQAVSMPSCPVVVSTAFSPLLAVAQLLPALFQRPETTALNSQ